MTAAATELRRYRFSPLVRTGLFGGMPTAQVVVLGIGCGLSFIGILFRLFPWAVLPALLAAVIGFKRVGDMALHELIPLRWNWWRRRRRGDHQWFRPVPLLGESANDPLPPQMRGLELLDVPATWVITPGRVAGVGVVHDTDAGTVTATLRVAGDGQFSLSPAAEQDAKVGMWGDALPRSAASGRPSNESSGRNGRPPNASRPMTRRNRRHPPNREPRPATTTTCYDEPRPDQ